MFISEYNYALNLPETWSEYITDEEKTNAFFNTKKWTGNLRITPTNHQFQNPDFLNELRIENNATEIMWNNIHGIQYNDNNEGIYYWYLIVENTLFLCSFTLGDLPNTIDIQNELLIVESILKTIKKITFVNNIR